MVDSQLRAARIAAVAAIVAAVISGSSGIATYISSQNQIAAEDKRSSDEFLRSQRQHATAEFMVEHQALRAAQLEYSRSVMRLGITPVSRAEVAAARAASQAVDDGFQKFDRAYVAFMLVAPDELDRVANTLRAGHAAIFAETESPDRFGEDRDLGSYSQYEWQDYSDAEDRENGKLDQAFNEQFVPMASAMIMVR